MFNSVQLVSPQLFVSVDIRFIKSDGSTSEVLSGNDIELFSRKDTTAMVIREHVSKKVHVNTSLKKGLVGYRVNKLCFSVLLNDQPVMIIFENSDELERFEVVFNALTGQNQSSKCRFNERTEESSAVQYFQFYGYLSQQQNMMQDYTRTSTYQRAILQNINDFKDKVILDVGAGTGILSFFALQAGAKKVYAVEASTMAQHAETLVRENSASTIIEVVAGKIEEINLPEDVDVIISEPMGYMLFNERMLETYLHAKKWLKPNGKMFPTRGDIHIAPFTDDSLYMEHYSKSNFWCQNSFYGVDLTSLRQAAIQEYFKQPIVDTFDVRILMAKPCTYQVDFLTTKERDLERIQIPLQYTMLMTGTLHGLAFWFDVGFFGSAGNVWLSTAPQEPLTHWYQVRCLLPNPVFVRAGQRVSGGVLLIANERQSYDVEIEVVVEGTGVRAKNVLDLKNPFFRYTGVQTVPPPGNHSQSPTDAYWGNAGVVLNGGVLSSAVGSYGGGGLFAYSSQAVGNVMATGTGSYTNQSIDQPINRSTNQSIGSVSSYGSQGVVINSRYNPSTPAPTYGIYQAGYIQ